MRINNACMVPGLMKGMNSIKRAKDSVTKLGGCIAYKVMTVIRVLVLEKKLGEILIND